ncbi:ATP-binding cassette domain-containing protein [Leucobacter sp. W1153]|uniref:ATP-binding cassette domain-containing protein n=1 Tax=Leucobacter sp. W1153 TaxID=3439064 RepID=UPI003F2E6543
MIHAVQLSKIYGEKRAVDQIDFTVVPGKVTGFLGPNGAGKSTTMRMVTGLARPTSGSVTVNGRRYVDFAAPLFEVGALLDARSAHKRRSAYKHLLTLAATHRIPRARVHEVMGITGIEDVAHKRVGGFSLGMTQRLGIASALLGDPETVIFDEPINGLDPDGIMWIRELLRCMAREGRTVLLSSHLMSEMAHTADELIVIGRGRILANGPLQSVVGSVTTTSVRVRTHNPERLCSLLSTSARSVISHTDGAIEVTGLSAEQIASAASNAGIVLHEVVTHSGSLEDAYLALTAGAVEYESHNLTSDGAR